MSETWYVYQDEEIAYTYQRAYDDLIADPSWSSEAAVALAVARWAGLDGSPLRCQPLPGGVSLYFPRHDTVVSPVPLPWMPVDSRRGMYQRVKGAAK